MEKFEDLVTLLLIPIVSRHFIVSPLASYLPKYFFLSGLKTNLGLLDTGIIWGYIILLCVVAFIGKFVGCAIVARVCGFNIRESSAIGTFLYYFSLAALDD